MIEPKRLEAETFFDYIVLPSSIENSPYLVIGNLYVKNTGNEDLYNPVICLRATPPDSIKLRGQVLPANMVETLGIQSSEGMKGWKFLEDDWFQNAKERGEFWISPLEPVRISPKQVEPFHNFQLAILKPETGNTVTIDGFVFFHEQELQFAANNRIAFSF